MVTTDVNSVLLDTNVLLTATTPTRRSFENALAILDEWPNRGVELYVSGQILREYLVVATRPTERNGLGLSVANALSNVAAVVERARVLGEGPEVAGLLRHLLRTVACRGKQIHDANLVATALVHGIPGIVTANVRDFNRFSDRLEILPL